MSLRDYLSEIKQGTYLYSKKTFSFNGKKLNYFVNRYNFTGMNERAVEISIFQSILQSANDKKILEVGNVLSHYLVTKHDVLDKYEKGKNVINEDVVSYASKQKYDLIISVSTLEHVGWDEKIKSKDKILKAIDNLKKLTKKNGRIIFSVPVGYNPYLDEILNKDKITLFKATYIKRISSNNFWVEVSKEEAMKSKYAEPFSNANALLIGEIRVSK